MDNYKNYIGKCYERIIDKNNTERYVFKIEDFDGKYFIVTAYGLYLGFSTLELRLRMLVSFLDKENFKEIPVKDYEIIMLLCIDPYVTDWSNEDSPKYSHKLVNKENLNWIPVTEKLPKIHSNGFSDEVLVERKKWRSFCSKIT